MRVVPFRGRNLLYLGLNATFSGETWSGAARSYFHLRAKYSHPRVTEQVPLSPPTEPIHHPSHSTRSSRSPRPLLAPRPPTPSQSVVIFLLATAGTCAVVFLQSNLEQQYAPAVAERASPWVIPVNIMIAESQWFVFEFV